MTSKKTKLIVAALLVIVTLLALRVIFDSRFDDFSRFIETRENYDGGTEKFDEDFQGLVDWENDYKEAHPDATDKEIDQAFKDAWGE